MRAIDPDILFTLFSTILLVLFLVAGIFVVFYVSSRHRFKQQMLLAETKLNYERELRTVETELTEAMMTQFARELHDNIGQLLTALHLQLENLKLDHPGMAEPLRPADIYVTEIDQQLRLLSRTLNNDHIGRTGLFGAIQLEAERLKVLKRFAVEYRQPSGKSNLEKNQELIVFRIFQEIVQNALRHAEAKTFVIAINNQDEQFEMRISDDGKGFDPASLDAKGKLSGLDNIRKRAALAGMELQVESAPGKGTLFIIKKVSKLD